MNMILLHSCFVFEQLLKRKHNFLLISCSELHQNFVVTVSRHSCNLFSMIIRCSQMMKQAYVHVLIFTELSLYVKCSRCCFAFIKYKRGVFSLFYFECFVIWKILVFVSMQSVKVAPQKTLRMLPQRSPTVWILIV